MKRVMDIRDVKDRIFEIESIERGDILINKRGKPFAVILDYAEYIKMSTKGETSSDDKVDILKGLKNSLNLMKDKS